MSIRHIYTHPVTWWRLTDAAKCYRIPENTLRRWTGEGRLTVARKGHTLYVALEEAQQLARTSSANPGHAMKPAIRPAFGAVLGRLLDRWSRGPG